MDDQLFPLSKREHHQFQPAAGTVEAQPELTSQGCHLSMSLTKTGSLAARMASLAPLMLEGGRVDLHET